TTRATTTRSSPSSKTSASARASRGGWKRRRRTTTSASCTCAAANTTARSPPTATRWRASRRCTIRRVAPSASRTSACSTTSAPPGYELVLGAPRARGGGLSGVLCGVSSGEAGVLMKVRASYDCARGLLLCDCHLEVTWESRQALCRFATRDVGGREAENLFL